MHCQLEASDSSDILYFKQNGNLLKGLKKPGKLRLKFLINGKTYIK